jgi:hypothetical protein
MAKIKSVELLSIPEEIHLGDDLIDITVITHIEMHPLDIKLQMPYLLHLFVYDVRGDMDVPLMISNWDNMEVFAYDHDGRLDDFLGTEAVSLVAKDAGKKIITPMALKLGNIAKGSTYFNRNLKVFATLVPAISRASLWSEPFVTKLVH